jgi:RNA polymerase sigma-70 factor (ECF subfamily)
MDLATLLERCRRGDELAWEAFVRQYQSRVYGIAYHYAGNPDDARDLAQEIFVRLYEKRGRWVAPEQFLPWLIRLSRNACIDQLRRRAARPSLTGVSLDQVADVRASGGDPEDVRAAGARKRLLFRALQSLGALSREIILLKDIQGLSLEEAAGVLGVPIGTVKSRSNRARIELAQKVLALDADAGKDAW